MDIKLAKDIEQILNSPQILDVLMKYFDSRIEKNRIILENQLDARFQGAIQELRILKGIREQALNVLNNKDK